MITELNFCDHIEQATGKVLGVDYGFIAGTHTPYCDTYVSKGLTSSLLQIGYIIWKRTDKGNVEQLKVTEIPKTIEDSLKLTIEWLQK